jgi:hypothetical protein
MSKSISAETLLAAAALIDLNLAPEEVGPVGDRLAVLLDGLDQISHLAEDTAELDARFSALWEVEPV